MKTKILFGTLILTVVLAVQSPAQSIPADGLVAYYPFNGNANDQSGNGHNGVLNGDTITPAVNQSGKRNAALHFQGGSRVSVAPTPFNVNSNWTISLWCKIDETQTAPNNMVSTALDNSGGVNVRWWGNDPQLLRWQLIANYIGSGTTIACYSNATNNPYAWNMVTGVRNGYSFELFLNGTLIRSNTLVGTSADTGSLWFGMHQTEPPFDWATYDFNGSLSDILIYDRPLSPSEIQQIYAGESPAAVPRRVTTPAAAAAVPEPAGAISAPVSLGFSPTLTINGVAGHSYIIQTSTNLADPNAWVTVTNVTLSEPTQIWVDTSAKSPSPSSSAYFYRVLPEQ